MNQTQDSLLSHQIIKQLRLCGHFLHYKIGGGRVGRKRILTLLSENQELLQRDLQDMLGVQSGSLSEMIIKMEADGLVEKVRSQKDGRQLVLRLTPEGLAQAEAFKEKYDEQVEKMMCCLSDEQMHELHKLLDITVTHWKEIEKDIEFPMQEDGKIPHNCVKPK